jgi:hypothetical protein
MVATAQVSWSPGGPGGGLPRGQVRGGLLQLLLAEAGPAQRHQPAPAQAGIAPALDQRRGLGHPRGRVGPALAPVVHGGLLEQQLGDGRGIAGRLGVPAAGHQVGQRGGEALHRVAHPGPPGQHLPAPGIFIVEVREGGRVVLVALLVAVGGPGLLGEEEVVGERLLVRSAEGGVAGDDRPIERAGFARGQRRQHQAVELAPPGRGQRLLERRAQERVAELPAPVRLRPQHPEAGQAVEGHLRIERLRGALGGADGALDGDDVGAGELVPQHRAQLGEGAQGGRGPVQQAVNQPRRERRARQGDQLVARQAPALGPRRAPDGPRRPQRARDLHREQGNAADHLLQRAEQLGGDVLHRGQEQPEQGALGLGVERPQAVGGAAARPLSPQGPAIVELGAGRHQHPQRSAALDRRQLEGVEGAGIGPLASSTSSAVGWAGRSPLAMARASVSRGAPAAQARAARSAPRSEARAAR